MASSEPFGRILELTQKQATLRRQLKSVEDELSNLRGEVPRHPLAQDFSVATLRDIAQGERLVLLDLLFGVAFPIHISQVFPDELRIINNGREGFYLRNIGVIPSSDGTYSHVVCTRDTRLDLCGVLGWLNRLKGKSSGLASLAESIEEHLRTHHATTVAGVCDDGTPMISVDHESAALRDPGNDLLS